MFNTVSILEKIKAAETAMVAGRKKPRPEFCQEYPLIQRLVFNENLAALGVSEDRGGWRVKLRYAKQILRYELFDRQRAKFRKQSMVFLTPSTGRRFETSEGWYDSTVETIVNSKHPKMVGQDAFCYEVPAFGTYRDRKSRASYYLGLPEIAHRIFKRMIPSRHGLSAELTEDLSRFRNLITEQGLVCNSLSDDRYKKSHAYLHDRARSFEKQLRNMSSRVVFTYPWYGQINMAMMLAANCAELVTVDCQHGVQGPLHAAYTDWPEFARNSKLLPRQFFVWTVQDKRWLETWIGEGRSAYVTGIPWHALNDKTAAEDRHHLAFLSALGKQKQKRKGTILVSLQPGRQDFYHWLDMVLADSRATEYTWIIRNHPGNLSEQSRLEERYEKYKMVLPIDVSSKAPLISELRVSGIHITDYSSVVSEAAVLGIHSLMLSAHDDLFSHERMYGFAHTIEQGDVFWRLLETHINSTLTTQVDQPSVHDALDVIL